MNRSIGKWKEKWERTCEWTMRRQFSAADMPFSFIGALCGATWEEKTRREKKKKAKSRKTAASAAAELRCSASCSYRGQVGRPRGDVGRHGWIRHVAERQLACIRVFVSIRKMKTKQHNCCVVCCVPVVHSPCAIVVRRHLSSVSVVLRISTANSNRVWSENGDRY